LFALVWGVAILGIVLNAINLKKYKIISFISYLVLGWVIVFCYKPLRDNLDYSGILLLVAGGVVYTLGSIFYGFGKNVKYFHSIFHLFVLLGSILHFFAILLYVI
jgi:hemolysin III